MVTRNMLYLCIAGMEGVLCPGLGRGVEAVRAGMGRVAMAGSMWSR